MTQKLLMTVILLELWLFTSGQDLKIGTYKSIMGFENTTITIKAQNEFDYTNDGCTGGYKGTGIYALNGRELVLKFKNPISDRSFDAPQIIRENTCAEVQRIGFHFFRRKDKTPISFASVWIRRNRDDKLYMVNSDSTGQAWISAEQMEFPISVEVKCIGTTPQTIHLDTVGCYSIEVPLTIDIFKQLGDNDIIKFTVMRIKENQILMKSEGDKKPRRFIKRD